MSCDLPKATWRHQWLSPVWNLNSQVCAFHTPLHNPATIVMMEPPFIDSGLLWARRCGKALEAHLHLLFPVALDKGSNTFISYKLPSVRSGVTCRFKCSGDSA